MPTKPQEVHTKDQVGSIESPHIIRYLPNIRGDPRGVAHPEHSSPLLLLAGGGGMVVLPGERVQPATESPLLIFVKGGNLRLGFTPLARPVFPSLAS